MVVCLLQETQVLMPVGENMFTIWTAMIFRALRRFLILQNERQLKSLISLKDDLFTTTTTHIANLPDR